MRACGGTWVAHGSGIAAIATSPTTRGRVAVPPDDPSYTLRRVWLTPREEDGYYYGLANGALWPLCHIAYARPEFDERDWREYSRVNRRFADTVLDEIGNTHGDRLRAGLPLRAAAADVKEARPDAVVCQFWHIPWPNPEAFRICPWSERSSTGCSATTCWRSTSSSTATTSSRRSTRSSRRASTASTSPCIRGGHRTFVKPFPISIDPALWASVPPGAGAGTRRRHDAAAAAASASERLIFGRRPPRLHQGHPRAAAGLRAPARAPSRVARAGGVPADRRADAATSSAQYQAFSARGRRARVQAINRRFGTDATGRRSSTAASTTRPRTSRAFYRAADVCVVSSLHDGMNLVAKEFVASRTDERACCCCRSFTGAARALRDVVPVNPFAADEFAEALHDGAVDAGGRTGAADAQPARAGRGTHRLRLGGGGIQRRRLAWRKPPHEARITAPSATGGCSRSSPRYQHRLALPARGSTARRSSRGCSTRRSGGSFALRAHGRHASADGLRCPTPTCCAPRSTPREGRCEVLDFAPRIPDRAERGRAARGSPAGAAARTARRGSACDFDPRARLRPRHAGARRRRRQGLEIRGGPSAAYLRTNVPPPYPRARQAVPGRSAAVLRAERRRPRRPNDDSSPSVSNATRADGRRAGGPGSKTCALPTFAPEAVLRSALCLKLHAYQRHRRDHRRRDDQHSRGAGHRAHLGLPLLLAARRGVRRRGAAPAGPSRRRRGASCASCATSPKPGRCSRSTASAASAS